MPKIVKNRLFGLFFKIESLVLAGNGIKVKNKWLSFKNGWTHILQNSRFSNFGPKVPQNSQKVTVSINPFVCDALFSESVHYFFLVSYMRLEDYMECKLTHSEFFSFGGFWPK